VDLAERIRRREISSEEVVRACLERIQAVNPHINAVVQSRPEAALEEARDADAALRRGEVWGPFHGVPFTAKDVFDTAGVVSAVGIPERAAFVPEQDALVVARLKAAGAILLGKTNCPPGGSGGATDNPVYGRTNNPYNLERTVGGSSGGEAAILAAGGSPLGLGSDSGGSLRLPAHYCGVATIKPTAGRVPATRTYEHPGGLTDVRTQIGPLARYVRDLAPALAAIAGVDWRDSAVIPMPLGDPQEVSLAGLRMAFYTDDGLAPPTRETVAVVRRAAQALEEAGLRVEEQRPASIVSSREITERYWRMNRLSGDQVERLMLDWDRFRTELLTFMETCDVLLTPADHHPAPPHEEDDFLRFNYTLPFSLTGYPCAIVRAGASEEGLPIGVQVVARPWREDVALAVALHIEEALGGWKPPGAVLNHFR
jgi:amidase